MTATALPQLRPLGLGQLLDQAIRLYRRNFLKFIGIIAVVQIPLSVLQLGSSLLTTSGFLQLADPAGPVSDGLGVAFFLGTLGTIATVILSFVLLQVVATAALTRAVAGSYLGESVGIADAYRAVGRVWVSLLGAFLLALVLILAILIWTVVPCVGWLTGLGMLFFFATVIMPLIAPTIMLEKQKASAAIRRAWDLARRRFWWVLGFVFILYLFAQVIITGPVLLISLVSSLIFGFEPTLTQSMLQTVVQAIIQVFASLIYLPLQLTAITLMYFDLRIRTEGFDLTLLAESTATVPANVAEMTTQAPQPESGNLLTMTEMGYFTLIEIGTIVLYFAVIFVIMAVVIAFGLASGSDF